MCEKIEAAEGMYRANELGGDRNFMRVEHAAGQGLGVGLAKGGELRFTGFNAIAHTPFFVMFVLDLHVNPQHREYALRRDDVHTLPSNMQQRRESIDLLERAGIIHEGPKGFVVDEGALRVYVSAVCNIGLPIKHWVPA